MEEKQTLSPGVDAYTNTDLLNVNCLAAAIEFLL
jgi:hypothetical protein